MSPSTAQDPTGIPAPKVVSTHPLNVETPLSVLDGGVTPTSAFYIRSNFPAPEVDGASWRLRVHGAVDHPRVWTLAELKKLGADRRRVTLECAGNGRLQVTPQPPGTPWGLGAAGTGDFGGVALRDVLEAAGVRPDATTCVFTGADQGEVEDGSHQRFQRSLTVAEALGEPEAGSDGAAWRRSNAGPREADRGDPLLAWTMNGEPLTRDHGFPLRLIVPRWYAVASVKWLMDIEVTDRPFEGWFQADRYMYRLEGERAPVRTMRVRSLITSHPDDAQVETGRTRISGVAWSGEAPIAGVEVQVDEGPWVAAPLTGESTTGVAVGWACEVELNAGAHTLRVRAEDQAERGQPEESAWNELGYGNNGIHRVEVQAG